MRKSSEIESTRHSIWHQQWLPPIVFIGPEQISSLNRFRFDRKPLALVNYRRLPRIPNAENSVAHGYLNDAYLKGLYKNPAPFVAKFAKSQAIITPDFSNFAEMPRHERVRSIWASRAVGAYFQYRGLNVLPNIRWTDAEDIAIATLGVPKRSSIAISTQSIGCGKMAHQFFNEGLRQVLCALEPDCVLIYGTLSSAQKIILSEVPAVWSYPTDATLAFDSRKR